MTFSERERCSLLSLLWHWWFLCACTGVAAPWTEIGDFTSDEAGSQFGFAVALSLDGSVLAVGANMRDGSGNNKGRVTAYQYSGSGTTWSQKGGNINGNTNQRRLGNAVALSADGSILAVGASNKDDGTAYVYGYDGSDWNQLGGNIVGEANIGSGSGQFGYAVALSADGKTLAVSDVKNDIGSASYAADAGHVMVFTYDTSAGWTQLGADIDGEAAGDGFGWSLALSGDGRVLAAGTPDAPSVVSGVSLSQGGQVRVFEYSGGAWQARGDTFGGSIAIQRLGMSVDLSCDGATVAIGSPKATDGSTANAGMVEVWEWSTSSSTFAAVGSAVYGKLAKDNFGYATALSGEGDRLASAAYSASKQCSHPRPSFRRRRRDPSMEGRLRAA